MFAVVRCGGCGLVQTWPEMTTEELARYYPDAYYGSVPDVVVPRHRARLLRLGRKLYRALVSGVRTSRVALYTPPAWLDLALPLRTGPGRLLDVGAGWGRFLAGAKGMGWEVEGLDFGPSIHEVGQKLGIRVYRGSLEDCAENLHSPYDLISFNHVLEHLPDPIGALRIARRLLAAGGVVRVQVPIWRPGFVRLFGEFWFPLELPRHRWHLRLGDVEAMARRAGFSRVLAVPETGTHPLQSSIRLWLAHHPRWQHWQSLGSVDNRGMRALLFPLGWGLAAIRRPLEATFYLM